MATAPPTNISISNPLRKNSAFASSPARLDCTLSVHQDQVWHRKLANIPSRAARTRQWTEVVCDVAKSGGIHAIVINFQGQGGDGPLLDWWQFE